MASEKGISPNCKLHSEEACEIVAQDSGEGVGYEHVFDVRWICQDNGDVDDGGGCHDAACSRCFRGQRMSACRRVVQGESEWCAVDYPE